MPDERDPRSEDESRVDVTVMTTATAEFLRGAGLGATAEGNTAERTARAWAEHLLAGYGKNPVEVLKPTWADRSGEIVTMRRVPFVSVCAHHLLPFFGEAHLAYLPDGQLTGLSRLEELVYCLTRRLQVQERLTEEIVGALDEALGAHGSACAIEAEHLCVFARGKPRGAVVQTVSFRGAFEADRELQERFLRLVRPRDHDR